MKRVPGLGRSARKKARGNLPDQGQPRPAIFARRKLARVEVELLLADQNIHPEQADYYQPNSGLCFRLFRALSGSARINVPSCFT
jgi:hypothetical protein